MSLFRCVLTLCLQFVVLLLGVLGVVIVCLFWFVWGCMLVLLVFRLLAVTLFASLVFCALLVLLCGLGGCCVCAQGYDFSCVFVCVVCGCGRCLAICLSCGVTFTCPVCLFGLLGFVGFWF